MFPVLNDQISAVRGVKNKPIKSIEKLIVAVIVEAEDVAVEIVAIQVVLIKLDKIVQIMWKQRWNGESH